LDKALIKSPKGLLGYHSFEGSSQHEPQKQQHQDSSQSART